MTSPPEYFERVAQEAFDDLAIYEARPHMKGSRDQLFEQVLNPRYVLSELLQNADDAEATWVSCGFEGEEFVFEYNGRDFDEESLVSLCRFGYSNKRVMQTIGFRGIGFKTTFSLGSKVYLETPSLAFHFDREHFTLPLWEGRAVPISHTRIRVPLQDGEKRRALEESFERWTASPLPLLFFCHVAALTIAGRRIEKRTLGEGPVENSRWVTLTGEEDLRLLLVTSPEEELPGEALGELRSQRQDPNFTPGTVRVELIYGLPHGNRLFTVLPTGVNPPLPFSVNAPFIQDPVRERIREPSTSPTNRWLVERAGRLAADTLREWVGNPGLPPEERGAAYGLLPEVDISRPDSLEEEVFRDIAGEMKRSLQGIPILLDREGELRPPKACVSLPEATVRAWGTAGALRALGRGEGSVLHPSVNADHRKRLLNGGFLNQTYNWDFLRALKQHSRLPRPPEDERLIELWAAVLQMGESYTDFTEIPLVPVVGSTELYPLNKVVLSAARADRLLPEDQELLFRHVPLADAAFLERVREASPEEGEPIRGARALYGRLRFTEVSVQELFNRACTSVFSESGDEESELRLVRVAAMADLLIPNEGFHYLRRDGEWCTGVPDLVFPDPRWEGDLLPEEWLSSHCLSECYLGLFDGETRKLYDAWLHSPKSRLSAFPPPVLITTQTTEVDRVARIAQSRNGADPDLSGALYQKKVFIIKDFDWDPALVRHWEQLSVQDSDVWARVAEAVIATWAPESKKFSEAHITRKRGSSYVMVSDHLLAGWVHRLRQLPCVREQRSGKPLVPSELLRRSPATQSLEGQMPFVRRELDVPQASAFLDLLGVRHNMKDLGSVLDRLEELGRVPDPPVTHLRGLYQTIDAQWTHLDPEQQLALRSRFKERNLIFGDDHRWHRSGAVYQSNDEEVPDVALVHRELRAADLWDHLSVPRAPTLDQVFEYIRTLPSGQVLEEQDRRLVIAVLKRDPARSFDETGHWLSCQGSLEPVGRLQYYLSDRAPLRQGKYSPEVLRRTADLTFPLSVATDHSALPWASLVEAVEDRVDCQDLHPYLPPDWMRALAVGLLRIDPPAGPKGDSSEALRRDRGRALRLYRTRYYTASSIASTPHLDGVPAGPRKEWRALWKDHSLYVTGEEPSHLGQLSDQISGPFETAELKAVIGHCIGRDPRWIEVYLRDHRLRPLEEVESEIREHERLEGMEVEGAVTEGDDQNSAQPVPGSAQTSREWMPTPIPRPPATMVSSEKADAETVSPSVSPGGEGNGPGRSSGVAQGNGDGRGSDSGAGRAGEDALVSAVRPPRTEEELTPIYKLARELGFRWIHERGLFLRSSDGNVLRREAGSRVWTRYDGAGTDLQRFLELGSPFEQGNEIPAELWHYASGLTDLYLVASGRDGRVQVLDISEVTAYIGRQEATLSNASYRLKLEADLDWLKVFEGTMDRLKSGVLS